MSRHRDVLWWPAIGAACGAVFALLFTGGCTVEPKVMVEKVDVTLCLDVTRTGDVSLVACDAGTKVNPFAADVDGGS